MFDVTSLYTNIPYELGLKIKYWFSKQPTEIDHRFEPIFLTQAMEFILKKHSKMIPGTAEDGNSTLW